MPKMICRIDNLPENNLNPFTGKAYDSSWLIFTLTCSTDNYVITGIGNEGAYSIRLSKLLNADWRIAVGDFCGYCEANRLNAILVMSEADYTDAKKGYEGHCYNEPRLRQGEPSVLVHSTSEESWHSIQRDGMLKSWNRLKAECAIWEDCPIGAQLGDLDEFSNYIMFGGGVTGEIVVSSKLSGFINMDVNAEYHTGARMYLESLIQQEYMRNTMNIKTIIVDLDRTLLRTDKTISSYTAAVLKECKKNAIGIMVATARPLRAIKQYCEMIDFDAMVVSNGARVVWGNQRREYGLCEKSAERLLDFLQQYPDLRITLETGDCAYSNKPIEDYETIICNDLIGVAKTEGVLKILVHIDDAEVLATVKNELTDDLYYTIANGYLMQIMSKVATKWNGIKAMLEIAGCSPDEAAYFGDDNDDVEPMKMCGMGVAVANGIDEVKAVADYVAESNDADGVAKFLDQWLLNKLKNRFRTQKL